jgi:hypothetical protein
MSDFSDKQPRIEEFLTFSSRISAVDFNLSKTHDRYKLEIIVPDSVKPLTVERLNLVQEILSYSDLFDRIKIITPTEPLSITVNDGDIINVTPTEQYTFTVDELATSFSIKIGGIDGITFTNSFNPADFSDCHLTLATTPLISASKTDLYVTDNVQLSTINNELFTFFYLNTGSLILGFTPKDKQFEPSYYGSQPPAFSFNGSTLAELETAALAYLDPLNYNGLTTF